MDPSKGSKQKKPGEHLMACWRGPVAMQRTRPVGTLVGYGTRVVGMGVGTGTVWGGYHGYGYGTGYSIEANSGKTTVLRPTVVKPLF